MKLGRLASKRDLTPPEEAAYRERLVRAFREGYTAALRDLYREIVEQTGSVATADRLYRECRKEANDKRLITL